VLLLCFAFEGLLISLTCVLSQLHALPGYDEWTINFLYHEQFGSSLIVDGAHASSCI
jgi:hypothetical protein